MSLIQRIPLNRRIQSARSVDYARCTSSRECHLPSRARTCLPFESSAYRRDLKRVGSWPVNTWRGHCSCGSCDCVGIDLMESRVSRSRLTMAGQVIGEMVRARREERYQEESRPRSWNWSDDRSCNGASRIASSLATLCPSLGLCQLCLLCFAIRAWRAQNVIDQRHKQKQMTYRAASAFRVRAPVCSLLSRTVGLRSVVVAIFDAGFRGRGRMLCDAGSS